MKKKLHLISNAHLDPIWQWEWEEGCASAVATFRCAARFCREFDNYIFCHNEALIYRWVEEYDPALFREIRELVRLGSPDWDVLYRLFQEKGVHPLSFLQSRDFMELFTDICLQEYHIPQ